MSEISMYEAQKKKMQGLCDEHDLVYRFEKDRYPIIFTIKPVQGMDAQISMLENVEEVGYRSPDASMSWIFEDGGLDTKVTGGTFTISKTLRTKIESILVKMITYWQQYFFRDVLEKNALRSGLMPVIDEDEAGDTDEEPEDEGDMQGEDGPEVDLDDPDIQQAITIVRAENKATGIKEQIAQDLERYGDTRVVSVEVVQPTYRQMQIGETVSRQGGKRK